MKLKALRMNPERYARMKELAQEAGYKSIGKYVEDLLESKQVGAASACDEERPEETREAIEAEVERRVLLRLEAGTAERVRQLEKAKLELTLDMVKMNGQNKVQVWDQPIHGVHTIEDCARTMLDMLPEGTRNFAYEICEQILHICPSQLIHGHLRNAADSGLLQSPHIDPGWEQHKQAEKAGTSICEWPECRQPFDPDHYSQRYCSNICGGKAATLMLPKPEIKTQPILEAPGMQNLIAV